MARALEVGFDFLKPSERALEILKQVDPASQGVVIVRAVNEVTDRIYDTARSRMNAGINLTDEYLRENMEVRHATDNGRPRAVIAARFRATTLARYDAKQLVQPVKWTNDRIASAGHKTGKWPGWTKRKGDEMRGIPPDMKQAGVSVEVTRGVRKPVLGAKAFLMPLKNGNGMGVFVRQGPGKKNYRHLYAPSVYQLFRTQVDAMFDDIGTDLAETVLDALAQKEIG